MLLRPQLTRQAALMWTAEPAVDLYGAWLRSSYHAMRHTPELLRAALDQCSRRDDPTSRQLAPYLHFQLVEESGHHEWALSDLQAVYGKPVSAGPEPPAVANMVGRQRALLLRHPVALLSHIAALESTPPTMALVRDLRSRTGLPDSAFRTLIGHSELDVDHGDVLTRLLKELDPEPALQQLIRRSLIASVTDQISVMHSIRDIRGKP
ncbi:iron-containing redox enzyme family protein [Glycomyces sp. L485]|nr:iron-containing redox enzyme family protein [Glycomyces sp. L485]